MSRVLLKLRHTDTILLDIGNSADRLRGMTSSAHIVSEINIAKKHLRAHISISNVPKMMQKICHHEIQPADNDVIHAHPNEIIKNGNVYAIIDASGKTSIFCSVGFLISTQIASVSIFS
jgi:hypothetical protein